MVRLVLLQFLLGIQEWSINRKCCQGTCSSSKKSVIRIYYPWHPELTEQIFSLRLDVLPARFHLQWTLLTRIQQIPFWCIGMRRNSGRHSLPLVPLTRWELSHGRQHLLMLVHNLILSSSLFVTMLVQPMVHQTFSYSITVPVIDVTVSILLHTMGTTCICNGEVMNAITAVTTGGTQPYTYARNPSGKLRKLPPVLASELYCYGLDADGCTKTNSSLTAPPTIYHIHDRFHQQMLVAMEEQMEPPLPVIRWSYSRTPIHGGGRDNLPSQQQDYQPIHI